MRMSKIFEKKEEKNIHMLSIVYSREISQHGVLFSKFFIVSFEFQCFMDPMFIS